MKSCLFIPNSDPAITGHFPNNPIIPAALLLDQIALKFGELTGKQVTTFAKVRISQPLLPETDIDIKFEVLETDRVRFTCAVSGDIAATGILLTDHKTSEKKPPFQVCGEDMRIDAEPLYRKLPHAGDMQLVDCILNYSDNEIHCRIKNNSLTDNTKTGSDYHWLILEYAAQALACHGLLINGENINQQAEFNLSHVRIVAVNSLYCCRHQGTDINNSSITVRVWLDSFISNAGRCSFEAFTEDTFLGKGGFTVNF